MYKIVNTESNNIKKIIPVPKNFFVYKNSLKIIITVFIVYFI